MILQGFFILHEFHWLLNIWVLIGYNNLYLTFAGKF